MSEANILPVAVIVGVGGMGKAIARRIGSGKTVLLADFNENTLQAAAEELRGDGFLVKTHTVDVSDEASVTSLAAAAAALGPVMNLAHTAGLSPVQAPVEAILNVDLVGVALVLDAFGGVVAPNGSGIVIASMGSRLFSFSPEQDLQLATLPTNELRSLPFLQPSEFADGNEAYGRAKRANVLRVQGVSTAWGTRGARINSISPGIISTPMGRAELNGPAGEIMREMIEVSGTKRLGTINDIADAAAFLLGPDATFITGTDLLVDGGAFAAMSSGLLSLS